MISTNLPLWLPEINLLTKSVIVLIIAAFLLRITTHFSPKFKLSIWKNTFLILACIPFFYFLPFANWTILIHSEETTSLLSMEANTNIDSEKEIATLIQRKEQAIPVTTIANTTSTPNRFNYLYLFRTTWMLGSLALLCLLIFDLFALFSVSRKGSFKLSRQLKETLGELRKELNISRKVIIITSPFIKLPITFGLLRPIILLPKESTEWTLDRLRVVLVHELAHIKNFDYAFNLLVASIKVIFWLNPLIWWGAKKIRLEIEKNNDDLVIKNGFDPIIYASHLFEIAAQAVSTKKMTSQIGVMLAQKSDLKERIHYILNHSNDKKDFSNNWFLKFGWIVLLIPLLAVKLDQEKQSIPISASKDSITVVESDPEEENRPSNHLSNYETSELLKLLQSTDVHLKSQAALLLGQRKEKKAFNKLIHLTKVNNLHIKENAILAIGYYQINKTYYTLTSYHKHPNPKIRKATLWSLQQIGCLPAFRTISEHTDDENVEVRQFAQELLQTFDTSRLKDWIKLNLGKQSVKKWLLEHLRIIDQTGNRSLLTKILTQKEPERKLAVEQALNDLSKVYCLQKLQKAL